MVVGACSKIRKLGNVTEINAVPQKKRRKMFVLNQKQEY
jgi:hypothetical protein